MITRSRLAALLVPSFAVVGATGCAEQRDPEEQAWDPVPVYPTESVTAEPEQDLDSPDRRPNDSAIHEPAEPGVPSPGPEPSDAYR